MTADHSFTWLVENCCIFQSISPPFQKSDNICISLYRALLFTCMTSFHFRHTYIASIPLQYHIEQLRLWQGKSFSRLFFFFLFYNYRQKFYFCLTSEEFWISITNLKFIIILANFHTLRDFHLCKVFTSGNPAVWEFHF